MGAVLKLNAQMAADSWGTSTQKRGRNSQQSEPDWSNPGTSFLIIWGLIAMNPKPNLRPYWCLVSKFCPHEGCLEYNPKDHTDFWNKWVPPLIGSGNVPNKKNSKSMQTPVALGMNSSGSSTFRTFTTIQTLSISEIWDQLSESCLAVSSFHLKQAPLAQGR